MTSRRRTPFTVEVDLDVDAAYINMTDREVARTVEASADVNLDDVGVVVGIELLRLDAEIPFTRLTTDFHVHSADIELLRSLRPSIAQSMLRSASDGTASTATRQLTPA